MEFKVSEPAASGVFPVVSACGHDMGSFKTKVEAQKKAADLNAEYERMSEVLQIRRVINAKPAHAGFVSTTRQR